MPLLQPCDGVGLADPAPDPAAQARAAVRADRARTELRHGRAVVLLEPGGTEPALLVAAIETLDAARWAALHARANGWHLLLSRERLQAIGWEVGPAPPLMALAGAMTLETLQAFAALAFDRVVDGERLIVSRQGGAAPRAALRLAIGARLAPALVVAEPNAEALAALERDEVLCLAPCDVSVPVPRRVPVLRRLSEAPVPLAAHEDCRLVVFGEPDGDAEHVAVLIGRPDPSRPVPVRLHSSCLTGDLLDSLRCDCGGQLRSAIDQLAATGGVLLYLAQEGRGIGLVNKLRAYRLQDSGLDTYAADRQLGFAGEQRDFGVAAAMLQALGFVRVQLFTNNPHKIDVLRRAGIEVIERVALTVPSQTHNQRYVEAKRRAGHWC